MEKKLSKLDLQKLAELYGQEMRAANAAPDPSEPELPRDGCRCGHHCAHCRHQHPEQDAERQTN